MALVLWVILGLAVTGVVFAQVAKTRLSLGPSCTQLSPDGQRQAYNIRWTAYICAVVALLAAVAIFVR